MYYNVVIDPLKGVGVMYGLDEEILRCYFRIEETQRQRLWMERLYHPDKLEWKTNPPEMCRTTHIRLEEISGLGFGEQHYRAMIEIEKDNQKQMKKLVAEHVLWPHCERISCMGHYLTGAFVAAGGDITRAPTVSAFWKGMGLDVLDDGTVPRRIRGAKKGKGKNERRIPALPHVTRIGEQIRSQILRSGSKTKDIYDEYKTFYLDRYPDRALMFNHKAALRISQKLLYAVLWEEWRKGYGLETPWPYAFAILGHPNEHKLSIEDFYGERPKRNSQIIVLVGDPVDKGNSKHG